MSWQIMVITILLLLTSYSCTNKVGPIETAEVASRVAEGELIKKYGEEIVKQRPFAAKLVGDIWVVEGNMNCPESKDPDRVNICQGGVGIVELDKNSGKVIKISHGK